MKNSFSMWRAGLAAACAMMWLVAEAGAEPYYVVGWGMNANGQAAPVPVEALSGATNIAAGYHHSLAVVDSCVYAWGLNNTNQCTVPNAGRTNVVSVAAGGEFSAAIRQDGTLVIWGRPDVDSNLSAEDTNDVAQIAAGEGHLLILKKDGKLLSTGIDSYAPECVIPDEARSGDVVQLAAGAHFSLARKADGTIVPWGDAGQDGGTLAVPASLQGHAKTIAAGHYHALAITDAGGVVAWGSFATKYPLPTAVQSNVTAIAAGYEFSMALKTDGSVVVWGDDKTGQLDVPPSLAAGASQIAAGYGHCLTVSAGLAPYWLGADVPDEAFVARAYSGSVSATGMPAVVYHKDGNWPDWLELDSGTGVLSGTPAATSAVASISVIASNIYGTVSNRFGVYVSDTPVDPPVFITTNVPDGEVGLPYEPFRILASNSPVFYLSRTEEGYLLPEGLTLAPDGTLSGTPSELSEAGSAFYVTASNQTAAVEQAFRIVINAPSAAPKFVTTSPLLHATVGEAYSVTLATDRVAAFRITAGELPDGLALEPATGTISGTPGADTGRHYVFTVEASNSAGATNADFALDVWAAPSITTPTLPGGRVGGNYSQTIAATGWPVPVFSLASGTLPAGLVLDAGGTLSGKLSAKGNYGFSVAATSDAGSDTNSYVVVVVESTDIQPEFTSMTFTTNKVTLTWDNGATNTYLEWSTNAASASPVWKDLGKRTSPWTGKQTNGPAIFYRLRNH